MVNNLVNKHNQVSKLIHLVNKHKRTSYYLINQVNSPVVVQLITSNEAFINHH